MHTVEQSGTAPHRRRRLNFAAGIDKSYVIASLNIRYSSGDTDDHSTFKTKQYCNVIEILMTFMLASTDYTLYVSAEVFSRRQWLLRSRANSYRPRGTGFSVLSAPFLVWDENPKIYRVHIASILRWGLKCVICSSCFHHFVRVY